MKFLHKSLITIALTTVLFISCKDESNPVEDQHEHFEPAGIMLIKGEDMVLKVFEGKVDSTVAPNLKIPAGTSVDFVIKFIMEDGDISDMPDDADKELSWYVGDASVLELAKYAGDRKKLTFKSLKAGLSELEIHLLHNGHVDFRTPKFTVIAE